MSSTAGAIVRVPCLELANLVAGSLRKAVSLALTIALMSVALLLALRRLAGAMSQPLPAGWLLAVAAILVAAGFFVRAARFALPGSAALFALPGIACLLLLATITLPGTAAVDAALSWFILVAVEGIAWLGHLRSRVAVASRALSRSLPPAQASQEPVLADEGPELETEAEIPAGLIQRMTRLRAADGESIHALIIARIPPGDRLAVVHLAFCPTLAARPELTAHTLDESDAEVRIVQAETFGVRIEARLPQAESTPRRAVIEVLGRATDS
jgi:hypothetical protein